MFNRLVYENSQSGVIGVLQVEGLMGEETAAPPSFVPLRQTVLRGEIAGPLASLRLAQTYGYTREQCDKVLEAVYRFPLPGDAAVTGVRVRFGAVEIVTRLEERHKAETEYQEAVQQGKQAALLTRESPDVFTLRVAGIQPDQEVVVETSYVQLARPAGDAAGWALRVPLTTAPRYVREDEAGSHHAEGQPLALARDPGHSFSLDLVLRGAGEVTSRTHGIDILPEGADRRVRLHDEQVIPDRDFVLAWTPAQVADRATLSVMVHDDESSGYLYFLALVAPPALHERGSGMPREVILLVDHSGSMSGPKWEASDWAVNSFLADLVEQDLFNLGLFHNTTKWFSPAPRPATPEQVEAAARYLDENRDSGGTELGMALEQALQNQYVDRDERARHLLIVTDAQVSDAARILRLADEESRRKPRRRISVLCIDAAPNDFLANELAERGGGVARFLTSDAQAQDITTALEEVLADWAEPVWVDLGLEVNRAGGEAAGRAFSSRGKTTAIDMGDLPCGRAVWVAGRVPRGEPEVAFRLAAGRETVAEQRVRLAGAPDVPALKALFGARRVVGVEYLMGAGLSGDELQDQLRRLGYSPQEMQSIAAPSVYAENARKAVQDALRALLVRESLAYGLACAETAFIAVRTEAGRPVEGSVNVANALPSGWDKDFMSPPAAAAPPPPQFAAPAPPPGVGSGIGLGATMGMMSPSLGQAMRSMSMASESKALPKPSMTEVFAGIPSFAGGEAVLLDAARGPLPGEGTISRIEVRVEGIPRAKLDRGLMLLLYVGDMAVPRARIRLADLVRLGGRPLNVHKGANDVLRIVLADPDGRWPGGQAKLVVLLLVQ